MTHVPFEQRQREVVYIMEPPKRRSNGFGVAGFTLSLLGFITCGLTAPLGLLFSVLGLFRAPRGLATAGSIMGLMGTGFIAAVIGSSVHQEAEMRESAFQSHARYKTDEKLQEAKLVIEQYRYENEGVVPSELEGLKMVLPIEDGWRTGIAYEVDDTGYTLRSAGPDANFDTGDDITSKVAFRNGEYAEMLLHDADLHQRINLESEDDSFATE